MISPQLVLGKHFSYYHLCILRHLFGTHGIDTFSQFVACPCTCERLTSSPCNILSIITQLQRKDLRGVGSGKSSWGRGSFKWTLKVRWNLEEQFQVNSSWFHLFHSIPGKWSFSFFLNNSNVLEFTTLFTLLKTLQVFMVCVSHSASPKHSPFLQSLLLNMLWTPGIILASFWVNANVSVGLSWVWSRDGPTAK